MQRGFTLLELLIVVATIMTLASMGIPVMRSAMLRAQVGAAAADAKAIHVAFKRFYVDNNMYPNATSAPAFSVTSFEPLVTEGYYDGAVRGKLLDGHADAYDSPDDEGNNQEFWLEMTLASDPTIRFVVADSNDAPLAGGEDLDGIYMYQNGTMIPFTEPIR
jgi:prepilin-type N-terminal cleavage/methylation domain-containing protein